MTHLAVSTLLFVAYCVLWYGCIWSRQWIETAQREDALRYRFNPTMRGICSTVYVASFFLSGIAIACLIGSIGYFTAFFWPIWSGL